MQDATPAANHGVRTNFGPEGDAWGLSKGVFSLNFTGKAEDVTAKFPTNYKAPFATTGKVVNTGARFKELDDWTLENVDARGYRFPCRHTERQLHDHYHDVGRLLGKHRRPENVSNDYASCRCLRIYRQLWQMGRSGCEHLP